VTRRRWALGIAGGLLLLVVGAYVGTTDGLAAFGASPTGARRARVVRSPRWHDGAFENAVPTVKTLPGTTWEMLRRHATGDEQREPPGPMPVVHPSRASFDVAPNSGLRVTWLGHSTVLLELDGARVLFDATWGDRASPSTIVGPKRFFPPPLPLADLPPIDAVVISHDHYDHLDMGTIRALAAAQATLRFVVPLGIGAHLERWGVPAGRITELEWGEQTTIANGAVTLVATPSRHFSGRRLRDAVGRGNPTLWATWVVRGATHRAFFSGDTGFFEGFAAIGDAHGPFDLTMIKVGAYGEPWPQIHVNPEEALRAHAMLRGTVMLPIHWGTFNLAFHAWDEPADRTVAAAQASGATLVMPRPGETIEPLLVTGPVERWWKSVGK
jgi:L-ascorbate metabolism protein UlaG (beta-lactamase superfamily)